MPPPPSRLPGESGTRLSEKYVLGNPIGKGALGIVYEAQDQTTGETVAVKRVAMRNLTREQVQGLEQEVMLLKALKHPNIVKYIATIKTRHYFHLVLEFVEAGSLAQNVKKFGVYSPSLVALYTRQVLQGLAYLHERGVIHRDIKGANVLTDKAGRAKLADFGVATLVKSSKNNEVVVGTPYWMSPETIEMTGMPTTASDIWSVGATVIELLTGQPPYFDVPQMAALYRIVQDEHVPLPAVAPEPVVSFLQLCFVKTPEQRATAADLLEHPWIVSSRNDASVSKNTTGGGGGGGEEAENTASDGDDSRPSLPSSLNNIIPINHNSSSNNMHNSNRAGGKTSIVSTRSSISTQGSGSGAATTTRQPRHSLPGQVYDTVSSSSEFPPLLGEAGDRSSLKLLDLYGTASDRVLTVVGEEEWDNRSATTTTVNITMTNQVEVFNFTKEMRATKDPEVVLAQAWAGPTQRMDKQELLRAQSLANTEEIAQHRAIHGSSPRFSLTEASQQQQQTDGGGEDGMIPAGFETAFAGDRPHQEPRPGGGSAVARKKKGARLAKYRESADDVDFGDLPLANSSSVHNTRVGESASERALDSVPITTTPSNSAANNNNANTNKSMDVQWKARDVVAITSLPPFDPTEIDTLVTQLTSPTCTPTTFTDSCQQLINMFEKSGKLVKRRLLQRRIVGCLLDALQPPTANNTSITMRRPALLLLILIADDDKDTLELLAMNGLVPKLIALVAPHQPSELRAAAGQMVSCFLRTSPLSLHMFVACGGLDVLVGLLEQPTTVELAVCAVDGIDRVFQETVAPPGSQRRASIKRAAARVAGMSPSLTTAPSIMMLGGGTPKNDFKQLLIKTKLLQHLSEFGQRLQTVEGTREARAANIDALGILAEVAHIFLVFSQGGPQAKRHIVSSHECMRFLFATLTSRWAAAAATGGEEELEDNVDAARTILVTIKNLCLDPSLVELLDAAGAIAVLCPFLDARSDTKRRDHPTVAAALVEMHNLTVMSLFYLTTNSSTRQERFAVLGASSLIESARDDLPVRAFAIDLLCQLVYTSDYARWKLWKAGGIPFLIDLLAQDAFWQEKALTALLSWLTAVRTSTTTTTTTSELELELLRPKSICNLVLVFQTAQSEVFEIVVGQFVNMLTVSPAMAGGLARSAPFLSELTHRLSHPKPDVTVAVLKLIGLVVSHANDKSTLLLNHNLPVIVNELLSNKGMVHDMAMTLLQEWKNVLL